MKSLVASQQGGGPPGFLENSWAGVQFVVMKQNQQRQIITIIYYYNAIQQFQCVHVSNITTMQLALHNPILLFFLKGRTVLNQHHRCQQPEHGHYGPQPMLPIRFHTVKPTDLSRYCYCSDRYLAPSVALTSLKCTKQVTDSGSICGGCSINYVQFIKLHFFLKGLSAPNVCGLHCSLIPK